MDPHIKQESRLPQSSGPVQPNSTQFNPVILSDSVLVLAYQKSE
jgi:hypothetical protein